MKQRKGFTLVEGLFLLLLTSVVLALTIPVITQLSATKSNMDNYAVDCIENRSSKSCDAARRGALYEREKSINTLYRYVSDGTEKQITKALKELNQACLEGSTSACDLFIDRCVQDEKVCDIPSGENKNYDLRALLEMDYNTNNQTNESYNTGRIYLAKAITSRCNQRVKNILKITRETCLNAKDNNNDNIIACNIDNRNCLEDSNEAIVDGCNDGNEDYCKLGYERNINRTCSQIYNALPSYLDGTYSLSKNDSGDSYRAYCDMDGGGWTLLLKVDGSLSTFRYDSDMWTNTTEHKNSETNLDHTEHKSTAFAHVPYKQIKLRMVTPVDSCSGITSCHGSTKVTCITSCKYNKGFNSSAVTTDLIFSKKNKSALEMFSTNEFFELDLIRSYKGYDDDKFMLTTMPNGQLESAYFEFGINSQSSLYDCDGQKFTSARIGIIASGKKKTGGPNCTVEGLPSIKNGSFDRCERCKNNEFSSAIGIGLYNSGSDMTAGNYYSKDPNKKPSFAYLFVK